MVVVYLLRQCYKRGGRVNKSSKKLHFWQSIIETRFCFFEWPIPTVLVCQACPTRRNLLQVQMVHFHHHFFLLTGELGWWLLSWSKMARGEWRWKTHIFDLSRFDESSWNFASLDRPVLCYSRAELPHSVFRDIMHCPTVQCSVQSPTLVSFTSAEQRLISGHFANYESSLSRSSEATRGHILVGVKFTRLWLWS